MMILVLTSNIILSQSQLSGQRPKLVRRYEVGGSGTDTMMENAVEVAYYIDNKVPEKAVVRLCSEQPMRIAIATAAVDPVYFARSMFYNYSLPLERIIVSRSEDCIGKLKSTAATELWAIPAGGILPPAFESIKSCQIRLQYIETEPDNKKRAPLIGTYDHKKSLEKLILELKGNPQATGIVIGYFIKNPRKVLKAKLREAKRILAKSGLPKDRYFLQLMHWTGYPEIPEPEYLSVAIIDIVTECAQLPRQDEIIVAK
jgi:hypothetical protein